MAHKGLNRLMSAKTSQTNPTPHTRNCLMNASIDPYTQPQHKLAKQDIGPEWWKKGPNGPAPGPWKSPTVPGTLPICH
jgi:hypothetical protein